jgi:hypothetical protein
MKTQFQDKYLSIGIEINQNKILTERLNIDENSDENLKKQYELFHMDFIIELKNIQKFDPISFNRYIQKINETKSSLNFWGEKFEIYMHSKLIKIYPKIISNLKRGIDGIEPDILLKYKEEQLGIELTTLKFLTDTVSKEQILSKITDKILEKNSKKYSNENCLLLIDITNIVFNEYKYNFKLNEIFDENFSGFAYLKKELKFGMVILCNSVYKRKNNDILSHELVTRIGFINETKGMNENLKEFLSIFFNNYQSDNDYIEKFHHRNI